MGKRGRRSRGEAAGEAGPPEGRPPRPLAWIAAGLVAAGIGGWWLAARPPALRHDPGLSVLLVTIDTLRADAVGAYGGPAGATPWLDRLAAGGVRFENAHAHNVVTLPSHANILSGTYAFAHGVRDNSGFRFPADRETLATILKRNGWRTGAFVSAFVLDSRFGLDRGFDVYDDRLGGLETRTAFLEPERKGPATVAVARAWLDAQPGAKTLTFVHLYEPHFPYNPPEPFASRFPSRPYEGEVAAADAALEPLLRPILEAGPRAHTMVVVTGDHGESLGEHGEATHGVFAYESTLHVPLVVWAPGLAEPAVVRTPVRHVDIVPTILDALGLAPPAGLPGRSLLAVKAREEAAPPSYFEALSSSLNRGWAPLYGVLRDGVKYVDLPLPEMYDLGADPREETNLVARRAADRDRLQAVLGSFRAQDGAIRRVQEETATLEKLHALGYLAGETAAPKARYTAEDDPKRLISFDTRTRDEVARFLAGDVDGALALIRENIRDRPDMPISYLHLAYLERARGDLEAAVAAARKALELRPLDAESLSLLAVYLTEAGRPAEALSAIEPYMRAAQPDLDVLTARGMALAALGRRDEALSTFARARALDPSNAMVLVNTGTVHLMAGDAAAARSAFEAALALDAGLPRAHNGLGVIAAREGKTDEAVERWRRAVSLDPKDYQTLFNLGSVLRKEGRVEEARPYFEAYLKAAPVALEAKDMERVRAWLAAPASR